MIDRQGYRLNVGIILINAQGRVFWAKRIGKRNAWQFPQGGIKEHESLHEAMYRELTEETGLSDADVKVIGMSRHWFYYRLPTYLQHTNSKPVCIGQKQKWFLLRFIGDESHIRFDQTSKPEFDEWCWVDYWQPINQVIAFKRAVYRKVLNEFANRFPVMVSNNSL